MEAKQLGNPAPLGLIAFASTTYLLSMVNAGWFDGKSVVLVLSMALIFGGAVQAIAGIIAFLRGNTFPGVAFLAYAAARRRRSSVLGSSVGASSASTCGSRRFVTTRRCS